MLQAWKFDMIQRIRSPCPPLTTGVGGGVFFFVSRSSFLFGGGRASPKKITIWSNFFGPRKEQECRINISERSLANFPTSRFLLGTIFFSKSYSAGLQFFSAARRTSLTFPQPKGLALWRTFELLGIADFMRKTKI